MSFRRSGNGSWCNFCPNLLLNLGGVCCWFWSAVRFSFSFFFFLSSSHENNKFCDLEKGGGKPTCDYTRLIQSHLFLTVTTNNLKSDN